MSLALCKYCQGPLMWVENSRGYGWWPPFDAPEAATETTYAVWDAERHNWVTRLTADDVDVPVQRHMCTADKNPQNPFGRTAQPMSHEQIIRAATKLSAPCPTCLADPFVWCVYVKGDRAGTDTKQLHSDRRQEP